MDVAEAIRSKRAVREFENRSVPDEAVQAILNAGRRAQSSKNTQPWRFVAVRDRETLQRLSQTGNFAAHLANAPLGVVILVPDPTNRPSAAFDAGQSAAYMQLAAWDLGIGSCLAAIYHPDAARELLGFPQDLFPVMALSFGYPRDPAVLSAPPRSGGRQPLGDLVHYEHW